jgi:hypothetical protein
MILLVRMRVDVSTTPPGAYGTMTRIGLVGYSCAATPVAALRHAAARILVKVLITPPLLILHSHHPVASRHPFSGRRGIISPPPFKK